MMHKVKEYLSRIRKADISTLINGQIISQIIPIAFIPILVGLYDPSDFGYLAMYVAIVNILAPIASGRLEAVLLLVRGHAAKRSIYILTMAFLILSMMLLTLLVFAFSHYKLSSFSDSLITVDRVLFLLPIGVFFTGFYNLNLMFCTKLGAFGNMKTAMIVRAAATHLSAVLFGYCLSNLSLGLIYGYMLGEVVGIIVLTKKEYLSHLRLNSDWIRARIRLHKYRRFPILSGPSNALNASSREIVSIAISLKFGLESAGLFQMANRLAFAPTLAISSAFYQIQLKRFSDISDDFESAREFFKSQIVILVSIAGIACLLMKYFTGDVVTIFLNQEWVLVEQYVMLLLFLVFFRSISMPFSSLLIVKGQQKSELVINLLYLTAPIVPLIWASNITSYLGYYSGILGSVYLLVMAYYYVISARAYE
jgi:lipopolysaccharide exporter